MQCTGFGINLILYLLIHQISYTEELKGSRIVETVYAPIALFSTPQVPRNLYLFVLLFLLVAPFHLTSFFLR